MLQSRTLADPHRHRWGFLAPSFGRRRCCPARCPLPLNCLRSAPRFFLFTPSTPSVLLPAIGTRDGWPPKADSAPAQAAQRPAGTFKAPGGWQRNEPLCQGQPGAAPGHQRQAAQAAGAGVRPRSAWTDRERRSMLLLLFLFSQHPSPLLAMAKECQPSTSQATKVELGLISFPSPS